MQQAIDFNEIFDRLERDGRSEETMQHGGVDVRLVRVVSGGEGRWDHHDRTAEIVVVWSGDFTVEFSDHTLLLAKGQCCVVPMGTKHRGTSQAGANVILYQQSF